MTLEVLHDQLFDVMLVVDEICKKEGIKYFLDSGTAIGAVREKDFIPWDDDVDFKIMREDYPAFKEAMNKYLPEEYRLVEPIDLAPAFFDFVPRVIHLNRPLREETEEDRFYKNYQNRVGLDVFIFDKAPNSALKQKTMMLKCKMLYGMAMSKRYKVDMSEYSFMQKAQSSVCMLMGKLFSLEKILSMHEKAMTKYFSMTDNKYRFPGNYLLRELGFFNEEWYAEVVEMPIRDHMFPMPCGYHEELTKMYGEYMKPPKDRSIYKTHI